MHLSLSDSLITESDDINLNTADSFDQVADQVDSVDDIVGGMLDLNYDTIVTIQEKLLNVEWTTPKILVTELV